MVHIIEQSEITEDGDSQTRTKENYKKFDILEIYRSPKTVFTTKEVALLWKETDLDTIKARINYYVKKGKLYPLRRGIFAKDKNYNKFELATKIYTPSYVSLETVLQKEGVVFQYYEGIFVVSYLSREITCNAQKYIFKKIKDEALANDLGIEKKENYAIATGERAFLDALYLYKDYHFDNLEPLDWDLCFRIANIYGNKGLIEKLKIYARR